MVNLKSIIVPFGTSYFLGWMEVVTPQVLHHATWVRGARREEASGDVKREPGKSHLAGLGSLGQTLLTLLVVGAALLEERLRDGLLL